MDRTVPDNTAQEKRQHLELLKGLTEYGTDIMDRAKLAEIYLKSRRIADHDSELKIDLDPIDYNLLMDNDDEKLLEEDVLAPQDSEREKLLRQYYKGEAAKAMEAIKIEMQAAKESEEKMASKNKAGSDDNDNNESKKGDFKKNNLDSNVSDDDKERVATANNKRGNSDTVDSDKEDYIKGKESSQFEFDFNYESALSEATKRRRARALENNDEEEYFSLKCLKIIL